MTQVSRDGTPARAPDAGAKKGGIFSCCFSSKSGGGATQSGGGAAAQTPGSGVSQPPQSQPAGVRSTPPLLPPISGDALGRKCLVLDLDETLVHSSFKPVPNADYVVPIEIDGQTHHVYVLKRPFVDDFLKAMGRIYEVVLFTASLSKYADPVTDLLDPARVMRHRLFREHCVLHRGSFVKDLSRLGRDLNQTIIVDNSPASYIFQPDNAVACKSWFDDRSDTELRELIPFFENMAKCETVYEVLR